ncbi:hypothetical protein KP509_14G049100 [Ceratopteris richardii]|uniref:Uncharacterized protein n=1 Tax=Ceratopteris richardii TaxID=49495 RepID=A0A8T2T979_CERRI|nr:hypothetical protein KP509_14G049100 [Ceratopteris richardii]
MTESSNVPNLITGTNSPTFILPHFLTLLHFPFFSLSLSHICSHIHFHAHIQSFTNSHNFFIPSLSIV